MRYLTIFFLLFALIIPNLQAGNGSILILKSAYFYQKHTKKGKRLLTRMRKAYDVLELDNTSPSLMFKVSVPDKKKQVNGSGYMVETDLELQELGLKMVKVYPELPTEKADLTKYKPVPSNQISFTGRKETSADFPNLVWRAVNYKTDVPEELWIAAWAGIYRPDKSAEWLNRIYQKAKVLHLKPALMDKILNGLVEIGFSKEQVRLALGDPLKEQMIDNDSRLEWLYNDRRVIFANDQVLRVL